MLRQNLQSLTGTELAERAGACRLLARLFAAPPDAVLLADAETLGLLDPGWESRLEAIQVEFTRLFAAPGPDVIPVHQSVYTDVLRIEPAEAGSLICGASFSGGEYPGYLGGESCAALRRSYAAAGFEPPATEMPDHIAVELEFLAHLLLTDPDNAAAWQQRFLSRWADSFAAKVAANPVSEFYRRVGETLLAQMTSCVTADHEPANQTGHEA
jgi:TorA maturation chaperone TorD